MLAVLAHSFVLGFRYHCIQACSERPESQQEVQGFSPCEELSPIELRSLLVIIRTVEGLVIDMTFKRQRDYQMFSRFAKARDPS
jgi:hypothetical protein